MHGKVDHKVKGQQLLTCDGVSSSWRHLQRSAARSAQPGSKSCCFGLGPSTEGGHQMQGERHGNSL